MDRRIPIFVGVLLVFAALVGSQLRPANGQNFRQAPEFAKDAVWLDQSSPVPHSINGYRGKVVLIDFWEYTCINCIRDFAVLKRWYRKYRPHGFEIIGVHYGEFGIGHKLQNVDQASKRFRLPWPVVADLKGSIWNAYGSNAWPNRYLIDQDGRIVMNVVGEGNNERMERRIQELLSRNSGEVRKIPIDSDKDLFSKECGFPTHETYVGEWFGRGSLQNAEGYQLNRVVEFSATRQPSDGGVVLQGRWRPLQDGVTSAAPNVEARHRYHARSVYAVMSRADKPVRLRVLQDGKPLAKESAGKDVQFDASGAYIQIDEPRMYYIVKNPNMSAHSLELRPDAEGFTLHSFTYGNNCQQEFEQL